jgi:hypothetical protein
MGGHPAVQPSLPERVVPPWTFTPEQLARQ